MIDGNAFEKYFKIYNPPSNFTQFWYITLFAFKLEYVATLL